MNEFNPNIPRAISILLQIHGEEKKREVEELVLITVTPADSAGQIAHRVHYGLTHTFLTVDEYARAVANSIKGRR